MKFKSELNNKQNELIISISFKHISNLFKIIRQLAPIINYFSIENLDSWKMMFEEYLKKRNTKYRFHFSTEGKLMRIYIPSIHFWFVEKNKNIWKF